MAEPARNLGFASGSDPFGADVSRPANDNAVRQGPRLRGIPGGRSDIGMATRLYADRARDAFEESQSENAETSEALSGGRVLLEQEPRSYTTMRRETPAEKEKHRQEKMTETQERLTKAGAVSPESGKVPSDGEDALSESRRKTGDQKNESPMMQRFRGLQRGIAETRRRMRAGEEEAEAAEQTQKAVQKTRKLISHISKLLSAVTAEAILPLIWLIVTLNIETMNILIFRKKASTSVNSTLNLIGLDIDVDRRHVFTMGNMIIVSVTLFVDMVIVLCMLAALFPLIMIMTMFILQIGGIVAVIGVAT